MSIMVGRENYFFYCYQDLELNARSLSQIDLALLLPTFEKVCVRLCSCIDMLVEYILFVFIVTEGCSSITGLLLYYTKPKEIVDQMCEQRYTYMCHEVGRLLKTSFLHTGFIIKRLKY